MATPPRIDVGALLLPIALGEESGPSLERDSVYFQFRQALRTGESNQTAPAGELSRIADLDRLIDLGKAYLERKSKDLVVAAWMAEALTQNCGFAGLRDGLRLMHGLISECWDLCHPPLGPDGDADLRSRSFEALASERHLILCLRRLPLADRVSAAEPFCYLDVGQGPAGRRPAPSEADIASGPVFEAISQTKRTFYERVADDLREASEAEAALGAEVQKRFQADAPDLRQIGRALLDCKRLVDVILVVKRRQAPDAMIGGALAPDATSGPSLRAGAATSGPTSGALELGRVLIDFVERARILADAAARLKENREKYASLKKEMEKLDVEYEEITDRISRDETYEPLLARRLGRSGGGASADGALPTNSE